MGQINAANSKNYFLELSPAVRNIPIKKLPQKSLVF